MILAACGGDSGTVDQSSTTTSSSLVNSTTTSTQSVTSATSVAPAAASACADVIAVELTDSGDGTYQVSTTVSSADTGEEKYADEWRVVAPDGSILGIRVLAHPHVNEQPFTRSLGGVEIPPDVETVTVEARDSVEGYCGQSVRVFVP